MNVNAKGYLNWPGWKWLSACALLAAVAVGSLIALSESTQIYLLIPTALVVILVLLLSVRYELLSFYALVFALPFLGVLEDQIPDFPVMIVPVGLLVAAWLSQVALRRSTVVLTDWPTALSILLGMWVVVASASAGDLWSGRSYWLAIILFILTQNMVQTRRHFVQLSWVLVVSLGLMAALELSLQLVTYLQHGTSVDAQMLHTNSLIESAFGTNLNKLSIMAAKGIPFALYFCQRDVEPNRKRRILLMFSAILMLLGVIASVSLTGILSLGATSILAVLLARSRKRRTSLVLFNLVIVVMILISPVYSRINEQVTRFEEGGLLSWGTDRGLAWYTATFLIRQSPWLGNGPGRQSILSASLQYLPYRFSPSGANLVKEKGLSSHNAFLGVAAELGIPGLLLYLVLMVSVLVSLWHRVKEQRSESGDLKWLYVGQALLIGPLSYLIAGLANDMHTESLFWILLGAGAAYARMCRPQKRDLGQCEEGSISKAS